MAGFKMSGSPLAIQPLKPQGLAGNWQRPMGQSFGFMKGNTGVVSAPRPDVSGIGGMIPNLSSVVNSGIGLATGGRVNTNKFFQAPTGSASIGIRG